MVAAQQTTNAQRQEPLSLFNARARYFMIRSKLQEYEQYMNAVKQYDHPGVLDLATWYANLIVMSEALLPTFSKKNNKALNTKHLRGLSNLELLTHDFQKTLYDCYNDLTQVG
ncbi:MAG: Uncharacterized protein AWU57_15 [Marinobacter sp. T13-3]|nr:MAG: Uncharacterized protein AWU57_15 [Marinobacter sp. T13-3]